jgi:hypothetical protein
MADEFVAFGTYFSLFLKHGLRKQANFSANMTSTKASAGLARRTTRLDALEHRIRRNALRGIG